MIPFLKKNKDGKKLQRGHDNRQDKIPRLRLTAKDKKRADLGLLQGPPPGAALRLMAFSAAVRPACGLPHRLAFPLCRRTPPHLRLAFGLGQRARPA